MKTYEKVTHTFEPVYDENSRILILGTFPSVNPGAAILLRPSAEPLLETSGGSHRLEGSKDDFGEKRAAPSKWHCHLGCGCQL